MQLILTTFEICCCDIQSTLGSEKTRIVSENCGTFGSKILNWIGLSEHDYFLHV